MPDLTLPLSDVSFDSRGRVVITNTELRDALENALADNDTVSCSSNSGCNGGCGNEVNGSGCGKANGACSTSFDLSSGDVTLLDDGDLILKEPDLAAALLDAKLARDAAVNIGLGGE